MEFVCNLLVLLCILTFGKCTEDDRFTHRFVFDSDDIELPCSLEWSPAPKSRKETFSWEKLVRVPGYRDRYLTIDKVEGVHSPGCYSSTGMQTRFEGRYSPIYFSNYKYMLLLPSTMKNRAGKYACKYSSNEANGWNGTLQFFDVHVVQKNAVKIDLPIGNVTSLTCYDTCSDEMQKYSLANWNVFQSREHMQIPRMASTLIEDHLPHRAEYKGEVSLYYCSMRGFAYTRTFLVNSVFKPVVYMKTTKEDSEHIELPGYESLILSCLVEANPEATIQWFLNSKSILESSIKGIHIKTEENFKPDPEGIFALPPYLFKKSRLSIKHVIDFGYGKYECSACNKFGCTSGYVQVDDYLGGYEDALYTPWSMIMT